MWLSVCLETCARARTLGLVSRRVPVTRSSDVRETAIEDLASQRPVRPLVRRVGPMRSHKGCAACEGRGGEVWCGLHGPRLAWAWWVG